MKVMNKIQILITLFLIGCYSQQYPKVSLELVADNWQEISTETEVQNIE